MCWTPRCIMLLYMYIQPLPTYLKSKLYTCFSEEPPKVLSMVPDWDLSTDGLLQVRMGAMYTVYVILC